MIVLLMILLSLIAVYFTRLLQRRGMKTASVMVAILYLYLIAWIYAIFILDIADLGFAEAETRISLLHGSNIYHSFVQLNAKMAAIPLQILKAIVAVAAMTFVAGSIVAFHGLFEIAKAVVKVSKEKELFTSSNGNKQVIYKSFISFRTKSIFRILCRMNC